MKKNTITTLLFALSALLIFTTSCNDDETYADLRKRENKQIDSFLNTGTQVESDEKGEYILDIPGNIKVISENEFHANDSVTDVSKNEYVLFRSTGVYMQIVRRGTGEMLKEGESKSVINRYIEFNIAADTITSSNRGLAFEPTPDIMTCQNTYGTINASFITGLMKKLYGTSAVPSAWITPLHYIRLGRQDSEDSETALVRLIVPSTQGHNDAQYHVYPCFYEISYQATR